MQAAVNRSLSAKVGIIALGVALVLGMLCLAACITTYPEQSMSFARKYGVFGLLVLVTLSFVLRVIYRQKAAK